MLQYINGFFGAYNEDSASFAIHFKQSDPLETTDDQSKPEMQVSEIASIVMDSHTAAQLAAFIMNNLHDKEA